MTSSVKPGPESGDLAFEFPGQVAQDELSAAARVLDGVGGHGVDRDDEFAPAGFAEPRRRGPGLDLGTQSGQVAEGEAQSAQQFGRQHGAPSRAVCRGTGPVAGRAVSRGAGRW